MDEQCFQYMGACRLSDEVSHADSDYSRRGSWNTIDRPGYFAAIHLPLPPPLGTDERSSLPDIPSRSLSSKYSFIRLAPIRPFISSLNFTSETNRGTNTPNSDAARQVDTTNLPGDGCDEEDGDCIGEAKGDIPTEVKHKRAYVQVIASFILYTSSWGLLNSFGVFQDYYLHFLLAHVAPARVAWIGSLQAFLVMWVGAMVGPLIDTGHMTHVIAVGIILTVGGMIATAFCKQYYQFMLAQGFMVGVGSGCCFYPSMSVVPQWYGPKHRSIAIGIVATGSSAGGVVFPVIFEYVQRSGGFRWAVLTIAFFILVVDIFAVSVLRLKTLPISRRELIATEMFRERSYLILCFLWFFGFLGLYIPVFFIQFYASTIPNFPNDLIIWMVPILTAGSLPGRVLPNMIATKIGTLNTLLPSVLGLLILSFSWVAVNASVGGLIAFALIYGFFYGAFASAVTPIVVAIAPNMDKLATRLGMALTCGSFGVLIGNPVAGAIFAGSHGNYLGLQLFGGFSLTISAGLCFELRLSKSTKLFDKV